MNMQRFIAIVGLVLSFITAGNVASAQESVPVINADGSSGTSTSGVNPAVNADGPTVVYGDLDVGPGTNVIGEPAPAPVTTIPGTTGNVSATDGNASTLGPGNASAVPGTVTGGAPGTSLLGPDGTYSVSDSPPSNVTVGETGTLAPAPEPVAETTAPVEPIATDTAVATDGDQDGDNLIDAREAELGLDPTNADADGDGVADGDEVDIYGTDPWVWDTDGDGIADGDELFGGGTDPLIGDGTSGEAVAAGTDLSADGAATGDAGGDSDSDRLADVDEAAVGTDAANPDSDGDGYFDGDEANLGSDPLDSSSFPAT